MKDGKNPYGRSGARPAEMIRTGRIVVEGGIEYELVRVDGKPMLVIPQGSPRGDEEGSAE